MKVQMKAAALKTTGGKGVVTIQSKRVQNIFLHCVRHRNFNFGRSNKIFSGVLVEWVSYNIYHVAWIDVSISVPKPAKTVLKLCFHLYFLSKQPPCLHVVFTVLLICKGNIVSERFLLALGQKY